MFIYWEKCGLLWVPYPFKSENLPFIKIKCNPASCIISNIYNFLTLLILGRSLVVIKSWEIHPGLPASVVEATVVAIVVPTRLLGTNVPIIIVLMGYHWIVCLPYQRLIVTIIYVMSEISQEKEEYCSNPCIYLFPYWSLHLFLCL